MTFEELDLFKQIGLGSSTEEERTDYISRLIEIALLSVSEDDLPLYLKVEEIEKFNKLMEGESTQQEGIDFLKEKIPNLDDLIKAKLVTIKEELIKSYLNERKELLDKEYQDLRSKPETAEVITRISQVQKDQTTINQKLTAFESKDWETLNSLTDK